MKFESSLDGIIECLQTIRKYASGDVPVSINLISDRNVALKSIYYDHNVGGEETIYIEGDYEDRAESSAEFSLFDTRDSIEEREKEEREKFLARMEGKEPRIYSSFIDDIDKMYDLMDSNISKKQFLACYSYLDGREYNMTLADILPLQDENELSDHNQEIIGNVANLMRQAENMYQEDVNDRPNGWHVEGAEMKWRIADWVDRHFTDAQVELLREWCNSMGV